MPLDAPTNCWPNLLQKFADALANSATFQTMVRAADAAAATNRIFGKRLTFTRDGRSWTREELEELFSYGQVYSDPNAPYGKHLGGGQAFYPHGTTCIILARLVPEANLSDDRGGGKTGLSDVHDREIQNIAGNVIDEVLSWLIQNGGPWPITNAEITLDDETPAVNQVNQGCWQGIEITFAWREGGGA
jgi:hypothetical protein